MQNDFIMAGDDIFMLMLNNKEHYFVGKIKISLLFMDPDSHSFSRLDQNSNH